MKKLLIVIVTLVMALSLLVVNAGAVLATDQGLTPGYWKNHTDNWPSWLQPAEGESALTLDEIFFGCDISALPNEDIADLGDDTLLDALKYKGGKGDDGGARILLRAAAAAYLNISTRVEGNSNPNTPDVGYPLSINQVRTATCQALSGESIIIPRIHPGQDNVPGYDYDNVIYIEGMTYRARMLALKDVFDGYNNLGL